MAQPNLIHSLDASNVHFLFNILIKDLSKELINNNNYLNSNYNDMYENIPANTMKDMQESFPVYTIHDSFATSANKMNELNWEAIYGNMKATVHLAPTALGLISYGFVLKAYLNSVHNRAVPQGLKGRDLINFNKAKHNRLLIFSTITIWAPLIVVGIRTLSPGIFKNAVDIEILTSASTSDSSGINKSGLMLVLRKMRDTYIKYIPENLRVIIK